MSAEDNLITTLVMRQVPEDNARELYTAARDEWFQRAEAAITAERLHDNTGTTSDEWYTHGLDDAIHAVRRLRETGETDDAIDQAAALCASGAVQLHADPASHTEGPWQPGDVVTDARGRLRVRSDHPHWVWDYPGGGEAGDVPSGSLAEDCPEVTRPLTLLVRDGRPRSVTPPD